MTQVTISKLTPFPGNPRRGDVPAIAESLKANGQFRPIVVQKATGYVLAGNHTMQAAISLGWDKIDVHWVDVDDDRAKRIVLADNRLADKGHYDLVALADLLQEVTDLEGTGYSDDELTALMDQIQPDDVELPDDKPGLGDPVISYNLIFDDEQQQDVWFEFTKWLKRTYSDKDTVAERLTEYLEATAGERAA
ncbi:ParB N-terminal domain-containing protein [Nocardia acidivorans]|uniref:ParB N-terminal domain-containing protein n=1 Tax=Nocardia acidivorans TaxID=404580 RepID=UPI000830CE57|nr:ParB N-terminal domain-containing protein [Nocardia acidivorans]